MSKDCHVTYNSFWKSKELDDWTCFHIKISYGVKNGILTEDISFKKNNVINEKKHEYVKKFQNQIHHVKTNLKILYDRIQAFINPYIETFKLLYSLLREGPTPSIYSDAKIQEKIINWNKLQTYTTATPKTKCALGLDEGVNSDEVFKVTFN
jgi:hypothetical protein